MTLQSEAWVVWPGGDRPVAPNARLDVVTRANWHGEASLKLTSIFTAECRADDARFSWNHTGAENDIMAYRSAPPITKVAKSRPSWGHPRR